MADSQNGFRFVAPVGADYAPLRDARPLSSLPVLSLKSTEPLPRTSGGLVDCSESAIEQGVADGRLWRPSPVGVNGKTLLCKCPECSAPLSIRVWLLTVNCWRCGASVAIDELECAFETVADAAMPVARAKEVPIASTPAAEDDVVNAAGIAGAPEPPPLTEPAVRFRVVDLFDNTPAWLASLMVHLILLILLALLHFNSLRLDESITLSTNVGRSDTEDVNARMVDRIDNVDFELPVPESDLPTNRQQREQLVLANEEAKVLRIDPNEPHPELPDLAQLKRVIGSDVDQRTLAVRDPRIRVDMIRREGGTTLTEAAVARGLQWMAAHQAEDGSWNTYAFNRCDNCRRRCDGAGSLGSESAGTSLCLLPFLGAGQTHLTGRYKDVVSKGLRWLIDHQKEDGDLRAETVGQAGMYAHGQATIVLCEAYALTRDETLRQPAQNAVNFIVGAQHGGGGWRYYPGEDGDTSVVGWQLMALQSARAAGLQVPAETMELAGHFLDTVSSHDGSRYAYRPNQRATHVMTAEAMLCRMYMGWKRDDPALLSGLEYLIDRHPPQAGDFNMYYWYYGTQAFHHVGGSSWRKWNKRVRDILVQTQHSSGHIAGSWDPRGPHASVGGRLYVTALAVCTLEVYYRHAPIFRQLDLY
ncbi:MAG: terpene cyclase/mutase family protein [Planctomycetales bacterium]|nr:terpene cyclase/mutase family protein [Planctomycetales bacterium]